MPLLLLLLLMLVFLETRWPNPLVLTAAWSCLATLGALGLWCGLVQLITRIYHSALWRDPGSRHQLMRGFARRRRQLIVLLCVVFLASLYGLGWGAAVKPDHPDLVVPGRELVMLAPLLAGLFVGWLSFYDIDRANLAILQYPEADAFPGRWSYLGLHIRHNLFLIVPPVFLLAALETLRLAFPEIRESRESLAVSILGISLLALALMMIPLVLRVFLGLKPLPDGPLRQRLLGTARRLKFRFADILVWDTRSSTANAMVTGVLPWLRYVVLTDRLIEDLAPEEIEAVFGHEVGHMKHHHMFFYVMFVLTSLMLLGGVWVACEQFLKLDAVQAYLDTVPPMVRGALASCKVIVGILAVCVYFLIFFGFLSRRCEGQADLHGCKTVSPEAMIGALEKVADLNGISRDRPGWLASWQHATIAQRIAFIQRAAREPGLATRFQFQLRALQWGLTLSLVALVLALRSKWPWDLLKLMWG
jgi:STE24 endopeptidase